MNFNSSTNNNWYDGNRCRYDLPVFSAGTALKAEQATEIQSRAETNASEYNADRRKQQCNLVKTGAEHGGSQKPHARKAVIEPATMVHWPAPKNAEPHAS